MKTLPRMVIRLSFSLIVASGFALQGCSSGESSSSPVADDEVELTDQRERVSLLPSPDLQKALAGLELRARDRSLVSVKMSAFPAESLFAGVATPDKPLPVPIQARRQVILQLKPSVSADELASLLGDFMLQPVQSIPELGIVVVQERSVAVAAEASVTVPSVADIEKLDVSSLIDRLRRDPRVLSAAPDSVLSPLTLKASVIPTPDHNPASTGEQQDWGIDDAEISGVWPRLTKPLSVGVIDVGFGEHADLVLKKGLSPAVRTADHGTHVSGILCAQHNNIGVRGALKGCTVVYSASQNILQRNDPVEGDDVVGWSAFFSEYLVTVLDFMRNNPDVKVINLSLGYNWLPNFSKDPRNEREVRDLVRNQGLMYYALLRYAADQQIALVTAAGNDSTSLATPLEARWASPFNFGSNLMMQNDGWTNGLVVEAHDAEGRRADFSNVGGDISCPGVDVLSTVAAPPNALGTASGTSMASPYCAAGLMALRTVLPDIDLPTAMRCIRKSKKFSGSVPRLDLQYAIENCSAKDAGNYVDDRMQALQRWAEFLAGDSAPMHDAATQAGCRYSMRREFLVSTVVDLGDGQGPEFADPNVLREVRNYASSLIASGCTEPLFVVMRLSLTPDARRKYDSALAIMSEINKAKYPGAVVLVEWPLFGDVNDLAPMDNRVVVMVSDRDLAARLVAGR